MKTLKKSLAFVLVILTIFSAFSLGASAYFMGYAVNMRGIELPYIDSYSDINTDGYFEIYRSDYSAWSIGTLDEMIEEGEAELIGLVYAEDIEFSAYFTMYGYVPSVKFTPSFDFKKPGYYHVRIPEGTLLDSEGNANSSATGVVDIPGKRNFINGSVFDDIANFFRNFFDWFKNLFSK